MGDSSWPADKGLTSYSIIPVQYVCPLRIIYNWFMTQVYSSEVFLKINHIDYMNENYLLLVSKKWKNENFNTSCVFQYFHSFTYFDPNIINWYVWRTMDQSLHFQINHKCIIGSKREIKNFLQTQIENRTQEIRNSIRSFGKFFDKKLWYVRMIKKGLDISSPLNELKKWVFLFLILFSSISIPPIYRRTIIEETTLL